MMRWLSSAALAGSLALAPAPTLAAASRPAWADVDESLLGGLGQRPVVPQRYRTLRLDEAALGALLAEAPLELTGAQRPVVELPLPDGRLGRFHVEESPVMEPALAARYPQVKTYRGRGIDDPTASARFGITSAGFHAIVLSGRGTAYIDAYSAERTDYYISYWKRDYVDPFAHHWRCEVHGSGKDGPTLGRGAAGGDAPAAVAAGTTLRTYRLAMAANYEYTLFHSGGLPNLASKQAALERGIIPTMNRVNAIYERELAIHMNLIAEVEALIWDHPADPYVNEDGLSMLLINPTVINSLVGEDSYDIGHVFSTGGGGIAGLGVVCQEGALNHKAEGVTGNPSPVGDPFDVDYVAHEMGHQYGGNHTFNGTAGSCSGTNRNAATAYEVGSGSTIQAYAGICGAQNLQPNSDDYFHNISLVEMGNYSRTSAGDACAAKTALANQAPTVDAGADFTIPSRTPFELTATGSDPDGDALTYSWEEFDLGAANAGTSDNGASPILRSFDPVPSPSRTFPKLSDLLNNTTTYGELLPTTSRTMRFRVTARDNAPPGGATHFDEMRLVVTAAAGPFRVTAPNGGKLWPAGSVRTVTWDVAGSTAAPVNAAAVDILLSTDGGLTFPHVLAAGTLNDGQEDVTAPEIHTATARVKVKGAGNVFFDISNAVFTIRPDGLPDALDDAASTPHNTAVDVDVLANDTDPDGEPLRIASVQSPTQRGGSAQILDNGTPDPADDRVRYTPPAGFAGIDRFSYTVSDGRWEDTATVSVSVATQCPPQPAPDFADGFEPAARPGWTVQVAQNRNPVKLRWEVTADPLARSPVNSYFDDASFLSYDLKDDRLVAPAQNLTAASRLVFWHRFDLESGFDGGVLEVSLDGGATWADVLARGGRFLAAGYNGAVSPAFGSPIPGRQAWTGRVAAMTRVEVDLGALAGFGVLVRWRLATDPLALVVPGTGWWIDDVQITNLVVVPETCPLPPLAADDAAWVDENGQATIDVLANDSDPNGEALVVESVTPPSHGTVVNNGSSVTYRPQPGFVSPPDDTFTYRACDPGGLCDTATVTVTVRAVNEAPAAVDDEAGTLRDTPVLIAVLANDVDPDGDPLTLTEVSDPPHGTAAANPDGTITYTPDPGFVGGDSFQYTACDPGGLCDSANVAVSVDEVPPPPATRVTGGGWIRPPAGGDDDDKAFFAVNARGGSAPSGKFSYWLDDDLELGGTVSSLRSTGPRHVEIAGTCRLEDEGSCRFEARLEDNGEPGRNVDRLEVKVWDGRGRLIHQNSGLLGGGNITVH